MDYVFMLSFRESKASLVTTALRPGSIMDRLNIRQGNCIAFVLYQLSLD